MEEFILSSDVLEQIKDFNYRNLTHEQSLLIDRLILNEELKERYRRNGLCKECKQPNTDNTSDTWCQPCNSNHFQQNFINWASGNDKVDKFIQRTQLKANNNLEFLEWIEYDRFKNIKYLGKGGFSTIYKAFWKDGYIRSWDSENNKWYRSKINVALKCLNDSKNITAEFLNEIESHILTGSFYVNRCYGITKDPKSGDFMMVMRYADNGSLRQHLNNNFNSMKWKDKLDILGRIAYGLQNIHEKGLIHRDFHCGNILIGHNLITFITDLGLCRPANVSPSKEEIYGVLPYVAPEVLKGKKYTQESDIYSFGIIAYEVCTGCPPYHDSDYDIHLATLICGGQRPKSNYKIPQLILNIIERCWDTDPSKRLKAKELNDLLEDFYGSSGEYEINKQIEDADRNNEKLSSSLLNSGTTLSNTTNSQAIYTSRLLDIINSESSEFLIDFTERDENN
ncbi:kinase-like domain-containing protein [Rhizophagus diaphanus]|nr:kinase-like domain-containing protein [Rhizophagus diaphanus] [Rhizophagus sp. MUCL 43196]